MKEKTCTFTGHRKLTAAQLTESMEKILEAIDEATNDGYTRFITGLAEGADRLFAREVHMIKRYRPQVELVAAISHRARLRARDVQLQWLLKTCDSVVVLAEEYRRDVYDKRNRWMVDEASRIIAAYDGRESGGTYNTLCYARKQGLDIRLVDLSEAALAKHHNKN